MDTLITAFFTVVTPVNLQWIAFGVTLGYVVGVIPGLGKGTAVAIAIPLTFYISPVPAIAFLIGIAKGSTAGSAVSAILLNAPGEPSSAPTALDGYPLARQGKAQKALKMGLFASVIGDFISTLVLIGLAQPLAEYALAIGPVELLAILTFSLMFIAGLSGSSLTRGLIAGFIGLLVATVGIESETATPRFDFGYLELFDGMSLIPLAIGMLAASEMMIQMGNQQTLDAQMDLLGKNSKKEDRNISWAEWKACLPAILRGTFIGSCVGILPGLGASVASFLSYGAAKRAADDPERFGKGALEGVAAAESADNAVVPSSLVPLFAIGIPGSVIAAILIGAFIVQGVTPGPLMFTQQKELVYAIFLSMIVASLMLLVIGYFGQSLFAQVVRVPMRYIVPVVLFFCAVGSYLQGNGIFGVGLMLLFAVLGFFARKLDFSFVTFLVGFVVGPSFELSLRQTIALTGGQWSAMLDHPVALVFYAMSAIAVWRITVRQRRRLANLVDSSQ
ncbi:MAG: putative tricarboxylic transport membrane protein [Gammaproteobacteria bacterium]|jgi:putative tricarboxylic transport membrane protein